jgi:hypothetical protein
MAMTRKKTPLLIEKPFTHVHTTLTALGFTETLAPEGAVYEIKFSDPVSSRYYLYRLPTRTAENGQTVVHLHEADFADKIIIPDSVAETASQMMREVGQYLSSHEKPAGTPIDTAMNGRMATTTAELKRLGKEMAKMPTNSQLLENGLVPDPIQ